MVKRGDRVVFRPPNTTLWYEGRVVLPPLALDGGIAATCRVQKFVRDQISPNDDTIYTTKDFCALPVETTAREALLETLYQTPTMGDTHSHLYLEEGWEQDLDDQCDIQTEGSLQSEDLDALVKEVSISRKKQRACVNLCNLRRKFKVSNFRQLLPSIIPSERNLDKLRHEAQRDHSKMLQLADAAEFGFFGWSKFTRLERCDFYYCAAMGFTEAELEENGGKRDPTHYPMGPPEALCAHAVLLAARWIDRSKRPCMTSALNYLCDRGKEDDDVLFYLGSMIHLLSHAIRRGWLCPLAIELGRVLQESGLVACFSSHGETLRDAVTYFDEMGSNPLMKRQPGPEVLRFFTPKATEIFRDLFAPSSLLVKRKVFAQNEWHVEFRTLPDTASPTHVLIFQPQLKHKFCEVIRLQDCIHGDVHSNMVLAHVWSRLVFHFHMGIGDEPRCRPKLLTFLDKPLDRALAEYVRHQIGDKISTKIKIIHPGTKVLVNGNSEEPIGDIADQIDATLSLRTRLELLDCHRIDKPFSASAYSVKVEERLSTANRLKQEGDTYYTRNQMVPARHCYSEAIDTIQALMRPCRMAKVGQLMGVLLSNRASCYLEMAVTMVNPESTIAVIKKVLEDCQAGLKGNGSVHLNYEIRQRFQHLKEKATEMHERLAGPVRMPDEIAAAGLVQQQGLPRNRESGGKGKKNKKQKGETRRQRQRRLRNNKKQQRMQREEDGASGDQTAEGAGTADDYCEGELGGNGDVLDAGEDLPDNIFVQMGKDLIETGMASNVTSRDDICPVCFDRFQVELDNDHAVVLSCRHACCLPCLTDLKRSSDRQKNALSFACPICRTPIQPESLSQIARFVVTNVDDAIRDRLFGLRLKWNERWSVAERLIIHHRFSVPDVLSSLDRILADNLQSSLWRVEDLTRDEKQRIYEEARKPVDSLREELHKARTQLRQIRDHESEEFAEGLQRTKELQQQIAVANKNAQDEIYSRVNSTNSMGREIDSREIQVDFHGLHVEEATAKFDELVLQILPVTGRILVIVGRGAHSEGGTAKLKQVLKRHIKEHPKNREQLRWEELDHNEGILRILWKADD